MSLKLLLSGYYRLIKGLITGRITWKAYQKLAICIDCDYRSRKWCKVCMCYLPAKARAKDSKCPKGYWKAGKAQGIEGGGGGDGGV